MTESTALYKFWWPRSTDPISLLLQQTRFDLCDRSAHEHACCAGRRVRLILTHPADSGRAVSSFKPVIDSELTEDPPRGCSGSLNPPPTPPQICHTCHSTHPHYPSPPLPQKPTLISTRFLAPTQDGRPCCGWHVVILPRHKIKDNSTKRSPWNQTVRQTSRQNCPSSFSGDEEKQGDNPLTTKHRPEVCLFPSFRNTTFRYIILHCHNAFNSFFKRYLWSYSILQAILNSMIEKCVINMLLRIN